MIYDRYTGMTKLEALRRLLEGAEEARHTVASVGTDAVKTYYARAWLAYRLQDHKDVSEARRMT